MEEFSSSYFGPEHGVFASFLTPEHGYPLLIIIYTNLMLLYLIMKVVGYRKRNNIKYPMMTHRTDNVFNCYQRAHHNTLELLLIFYSLFVPSAIVYPVLASIFACIFVTSRFPYAWGYYTGDPSKRRWGSWGELGLLGLFCMTIYITVDYFGFIEEWSKEQ